MLLWAVVPIAAVVLLWVSVRDVGPAYAARSGEGTYGTFRGEERRCHETRRGTSCDELWGTFRPEDGSPERYVRHVEPPRDVGVGARTRALLPDASRDEVYRAAGSYQWLVDTAGIVGSLVALGGWLWMLNRRAGARA